MLPIPAETQAEGQLGARVRVVKNPFRGRVAGCGARFKCAYKSDAPAGRTRAGFSGEIRAAAGMLDGTPVPRHRGCWRVSVSYFIDRGAGTTTGCIQAMRPLLSTTRTRT
jgi:hypothetical protein